MMMIIRFIIIIFDSIIIVLLFNRSPAVAVAKALKSLKNSPAHISTGLKK